LTAVFFFFWFKNKTNYRGVSINL